MTSETAADRFSFDSYLQGADADHRPELAFHDGLDFAEWQRRLRAQLRALLGPLPEAVDPRPEIRAREEFERHTQYSLQYRTAAGVQVPAYLLVPKAASADAPAPGILALHGHGDGKEQLVAAESAGNIYNSFARRYAELGFVVLVPDAIGFGERAADFRRYGGRDGCNVNFLKAALFGVNLMALNIWDDRRALDVLASRPEVDARRLGCAGLSFGGTRTMYLSALDDRIRAAVVSGYLTTFRAYALEAGNFCGSQFLPGIYAYADVPDIHGLIAPRPLLIEAGRADRGFPIDVSREAQATLARIYAAAEAPERLERDEFDGGHQFHAVASLNFMERWLDPDSAALVP